MKSQTFTVPPILGCLDAAKDYLLRVHKLEKVEFTETSDIQKQFINDFCSKLDQMNRFSDILESVASLNVEVINKFLKDNGFDISLQSENREDRFFVASVMNVIVEWIEKGIESHFERNGVNYPSVKLDNKKVVMIYSIGGDKVMASIGTKREGEFVYMLPLDKEPKDFFEMSKIIIDTGKTRVWNSEYDSVIFPMINYDEKVDISWIEDMELGDGLSQYYIGEAIQQTRFKMNDVGAKAESAAAMTMVFRSIVAVPVKKKTMVIDKPFLLWIERDGFAFPLFAGVFAEDSWKDPKKL